jgi:hypothetical protein
MKRFLKDNTAQALVESAIVLPMFLTIVFAILQLALIFNARFLLNYAAYSACRIGIVRNGNVDQMENGAKVICTLLETMGGMDSAPLLAGKATLYSPITGVFLKTTVLNPKEADFGGNVLKFDNAKAILHVRLEYDYPLVIPFGNAVIYTILNFKPDYKIAKEEMSEPWATGYRIKLQSECRMRAQSDLKKDGMSGHFGS